MPGEDHRLHVLIAGKRLFGRATARRQRVADAEPRDVLQAGDDVAHLAGRERVDRNACGRHDAELLGLELRSLRHRTQRLTGLEAAVDNADECEDAAVLVVRRVEDERAGGRVGLAAGAGIRSTIASRTSSTPRPVFAEIRRTCSGTSPSSSAISAAGAVGIGLREVDLVRDRDDLELVVEREVRVGERLRLDALRGVDEEQRALARLERPRDLVREVDVPGRVDEVQLVALPEHAHRLRLDRDPALALELHRVEDLLAHLALRDGVGQLEDAIGERRLAVVDVRDDREVADPFLLHESDDGATRGVFAPGTQQ